MNVKNAAFFDVALLGRTERVDQITETHRQLAVVEETAVEDSSRVYREESHVHHCATRGKVGHGVCLVLLMIDDAAFVEDGADVVGHRHVIERLIEIDR